ncbi:MULTISPECIES: hypothetical protein [Phyllobacteriaceae]|uniref:hypothetical protein n=1 Tax=Phyllobacteriaceae TaxID=69277 RepID=UPI000462FEB9|nr:MULTISPECIES: hypothetical protein [Mesorhizobium]MBN9236909.1 hypothetical protein [Mesorhizobium sp.]MDQ0328175.1 hypothetical protein [Mesorhizobium sp. YL-MeA3-2017]
MGIIVSESDSILTVVVAPQFEAFVLNAAVKFQIQFPELEVQVEHGAVAILCGDHSKVADLRRAFLHTLYREKIYTETLPLRANLIAAVTSR